MGNGNIIVPIVNKAMTLLMTVAGLVCKANFIEERVNIMKYYIAYRWKGWVSQSDLDELANMPSRYKTLEELINAYRKNFIIRPEFDADHYPVVLNEKGEWFKVTGISKNEHEDHNIKIVPFKF